MSDLVDQIDALLGLDARGALVPHGIGGLARELLTRCRSIIIATGNSVHGGVREEAVEAAAWRYDLDAVPRDRDFLIQFDHKEVTVACHSDKWPDGIKPSRALRPARLAEKVVAWQELPAPDTNAESE